MTEEVKVDKWDGNAVRNAIDDAVKQVMIDKYKYSERHLLVDIRLSLCAVGVSLALAAIGWDYLHPFPQSKFVLMFCAGAYFMVSGILALFSSYVERNIFLVAVMADPAGIDPPQRCEVSSSMKRYDDIYTLQMSYNYGDGCGSRDAEQQQSVAKFIDENGVLVTSKVEGLVDKMLHKITQPSKKIK